ncbi:MAG: Pre-mRNA-processing factor 19 [Bogoriella megaspora]|nr:MAG: Pre-mRNA-processing factor 19 [Bogoriella megaspora]
MLCAISGQAPQVPVASRKSGNVFDRRLIETYISENGTDPVNGEDLSIDDLVDLKSSRVARPRPPTLTSIPSLLSTLQNEWDALALETFQLRQQLAQTRQELSTALYQHDAAVRVIARVTKERDEARDALSKLSISGGVASGDVDAMQVDALALSDVIAAKVDALFGELSTARKSRSKASLITEEDLETFDVTSSISTSHSDGKTLAIDTTTGLALVAGPQGTADIYRVANGEHVQALKCSAAVTAGLWWEGKPVISNSKGAIQIFEGGELLAETRIHAGPVNGLALHATGELLGSVGEDKSYIIYQLPNLKVVARNFTDSGLVSGTFHPDGNFYATGTASGVIRLFKTTDGTVASDFSMSSPPQALSFSENGYWLAAAGTGQNTVSIWDLRTVKEAHVLDIGSAVTSLAWDPTGQFLAAAGPGGIAVEQYVRKGKKWTEPFRKAIPSTSVTWGAEAQSLVVLGMDGELMTKVRPSPPQLLPLFRPQRLYNFGTKLLQNRPARPSDILGFFQGSLSNQIFVSGSQLASGGAFSKDMASSGWPFGYSISHGRGSHKRSFEEMSERSSSPFVTTRWPSEAPPPSDPRSPSPQTIGLHLPGPNDSRFPGDGMDFRRPLRSTSSNNVVDLTLDPSPQAATHQQPPTSGSTYPQASRLPRFDRDVIDVDDMPSPQLTTRAPPQAIDLTLDDSPNMSTTNPPAPRAPSPDVEFVSSRPLPTPTPHSTFHQSLASIFGTGNASFRRNLNLNDNSNPPLSSSSHPPNPTALAILNRESAHHPTERLRRHVQGLDDLGGPSTYLPPHPHHHTHHHHHHHHRRGPPHHHPPEQPPHVTAIERGIIRHPSPHPRAIILPDDYSLVAFDFGFEGGDGHRGRQRKVMSPPAPAREGFTRAPKEEDVCVCPLCGWELGDPGEGKEAGEGVKGQVWVIKGCGHVYCGECALSRNCAKKKAKDPMGKGKGKATKQSFTKCVVPGCEKKVSNAKSMMQVFL